jgi:NitT/TauT family transport system permease protein
MSSPSDALTALRLRPALWRGAAGAVVLLVMAELFTRAGLANESYLPPASSILAETGRLLARSDFLGAVWTTVQAVLIGLALATVVAVPVGIVLGLGRTAYAAAMTIIEFLRPIPSVALIPLAILLYGRGTEMKVVLVLYACVWPILFNTIYGIRNVDPVAVDTARVLGFGRLRIGAQVYLPSASLFIFTGIKVAASIAIILAVTAELLAGGREGSGIGVQMLEAQASGNQLQAYAVTVVAGLIGLVFYLVLWAVERRLFAWAADGEGA